MLRRPDSRLGVVKNVTTHSAVAAAALLSKVPKKGHRSLLSRTVPVALSGTFLNNSEVRKGTWSMNKWMRFFTGVLMLAFITAGITTPSAIAQEKAKAAKPEKGKATIKVLAENDKIRGYEAHFKPGDEAPSQARPMRVIRALKGGTLMRTYADGKTEKISWKTGDTRIVGPDPEFKIKNVGKTEIVLYVVQPK